MSDFEYLKDNLTACDKANKKLLDCLQDVDVAGMTTYGRKHRGLKLLNLLMTVWESASEVLSLTYRSANTLPDNVTLCHVRNECVEQRNVLNQTKIDIRVKLTALKNTGV